MNPSNFWKGDNVLRSSSAIANTGEITLDVTKIMLVDCGFTLRHFVIGRLLDAYQAFLDIQGNMPTEILMTEFQEESYRELLEDFAGCFGIDNPNKSRLTFRGAPIRLASQKVNI